MQHSFGDAIGSPNLEKKRHHAHTTDNSGTGRRHSAGTDLSASNSATTHHGDSAENTREVSVFFWCLWPAMTLRIILSE